MGTNLWCIFVFVFVNGVMSTQKKKITKMYTSKDESVKIVRPMKEVDFRLITLTKAFDLRTLSLTYTANIIGPEDSKSKFNGTLRRERENNATILQAKLTIPAFERRGENYPVIVLSSESSSSTYVLGINTSPTTDRETINRGEKCFYRISSTGTKGMINYNTKATCYRRITRVHTYFKAIFKKTEKGSTILFDEEDEEMKSKGYLYSTSSKEGSVAFCYLNLARLLADGVNLDTLEYELLVMSEDQDDLVAFSVWSFRIM